MRWRIALTAACAAGLAAAGMITATAASAADRPHRCYVSDLAAGFHGDQAGLGNRGFILTLTDVSGESCRLDGYPRLKLLSAAGRPLPTRTLRGATYFDPAQPSRVVVLSPGESASADVAFGVAGTRRTSVTASYLEVTPPGSHHGFVLRIPGAPVLVYRHKLRVTAVGRHTPYYP